MSPRLTAALAGLPQTPAANTIALSAPADPLSDLEQLRAAVALARDERDAAREECAYGRETYEQAGLSEPFQQWCANGRRLMEAERRLIDAKAALWAAGASLCRQL